MRKLSDAELRTVASGMTDGGPTVISPDVDEIDAVGRLERLLGVEVVPSRHTCETVLSTVGLADTWN